MTPLVTAAELVHQQIAAASPLTGQELAIIRYVSQGLTTREIGEQMCLSARTVRAHLRDIYCELGAVNRANAVSICWARGLIGEGAG